MTNEELQSLPNNTIVVRTTKKGRKTEWIKTNNGREEHWAWFKRVLKDGSVTNMEGLLTASEIEVSNGTIR